MNAHRLRSWTAAPAGLALVVLGLVPGCDQTPREPVDQAPATAKPAETAPAAKAAAPGADDPARSAADGPADAARVPDAVRPDEARGPDAARVPDAPADAPPAGWARVELSTLVEGLTGTVDVPAGLTATGKPTLDQGSDGFSAAVHHVAIGPRMGGATLRTVGVIPPRFASLEAMVAFHDNLEDVSTHTFGPDHWALVQRWREGECTLGGWSKAAGLECEVFKAPCDQMEQWVKVCGSIRPGPTPNAAQVTARSAFPHMDPAAAEVALTVARAIYRDDDAMLLSTVGPQGVKIRKKVYTPEALEKALVAAPTVMHAVAPIVFAYLTPGEPIELAELVQWTEGESDADVATVWFSGGYGEQPYFELRKSAEGPWHLTKIGVKDLGEP